MPEGTFKIISHETATSSYILKYINVHLQSMKRRGRFDRIQCQDGVVLAVRHTILSIDHTYGMPTHTNYRWLRACIINRIHIYEKDDLNKRSAKHANKSTLVARGADTQLGYSCVSAPLATNVDLWNPIIVASVYTHR